ncbi:hypothetical protein K488DRAFT_71514 [Vararia minispora EC-137]|uniref:Uncharacterized protein n=1 Tax=Vararia minispora EC-137 TaxID=1314806 RepID=A0ACB8QHT8_9AGAM|nr:hypothetical protein K488DRAFT_71514 [Vararia minispora EC-137]
MLVPPLSTVIVVAFITSSYAAPLKTTSIWDSVAVKARTSGLESIPLPTEYDGLFLGPGSIVQQPSAKRAATGEQPFGLDTPGIVLPESKRTFTLPNGLQLGHGPVVFNNDKRSAFETSSGVHLGVGPVILPESSSSVKKSKRTLTLPNLDGLRTFGLGHGPVVYGKRQLLEALAARALLEELE